MRVLPGPVLSEIFDLRHKPSDVALGHLLDDLDDLELVVRSTNNYDHAIVVHFYRSGDHPIQGEIRIDRIRRTFDVSAMVDGAVVLPASGGWGLVLEYLQKLAA